MISLLLLVTLNYWTHFFLLWAPECVPKQEESMLVMVCVLTYIAQLKRHMLNSLVYLTVNLHLIHVSSCILHPLVSSPLCSPLLCFSQRPFLVHLTFSLQDRLLIHSGFSGLLLGVRWVAMWSSMCHSLAWVNLSQRNCVRQVQLLKDDTCSGAAHSYDLYSSSLLQVYEPKPIMLQAEYKHVWWVDLVQML